MYIYVIRSRQTDYDIGEIIGSIKGPFAKWCLSDWRTNRPGLLPRLEVVTRSGISYRLWEGGGGFDRNIYSEGLIHPIIEYIENNPIRRGVVATAVGWRWSSAQARAGYDDALCSTDSIG